MNIRHKDYLVKSGFTLAEMILVLSVLGILIASLFPAYQGYIERGRDSTRVSDISGLSKAHITYLNDNDRYPNHVSGCINEVALSKYGVGDMITDPLTTNYNGCDTLGRYGYASGSFAFNPNTFTLISIMEKSFAGNYSGSLDGMTGTMTPTAYNNALGANIRGDGQNYVRLQ